LRVTTYGFEGLVVYQRAGSLADEIRADVLRWYSPDIWTLGVQLIRAADSVAANIAEGTGCTSMREQLRFYVIARRSLREVQQWIVRATARELPLPPESRRRSDEIGRMLNGLIRATAARNSKLETRNPS
jgi:four helix bundle protein